MFTGRNAGLHQLCFVVVPLLGFFVDKLHKDK